MLRLTRKRLIVTAVVLVVLGMGLWATWEVCDWPPVRLILKYGFPPAGGPTGRRMTVEGIEFIELSTGYFRMGSHRRCNQGTPFARVLQAFGLRIDGAPDHDATTGECPTRWVEIADSFWMASTELTTSTCTKVYPERMYRYARGEPRKPAWFPTPELAEGMLTQLQEVARTPVRLPSEAEWEYACRAGSSSLYCYGDDPKLLGIWAHHADRTQQLFPLEGVHQFIPCGRLRPNSWGFFDMHGNAAEWCVSRGGIAVVRYISRGGSASSKPSECASSARERNPSGARMGLRPVLERLPRGVW